MTRVIFHRKKFKNWHFQRKGFFLLTKNAVDEIAPPTPPPLSFLRESSLTMTSDDFPVICGWHGVQAGALKCIVDQKQFSLVEPKISNIKPSLHHGLRADILKKKTIAKCSTLKVDFSANFQPIHDFFGGGPLNTPKIGNKKIK